MQHEHSQMAQWPTCVLSTNFRKYQKGICCTGIKSFSNFPSTIRSLNQDIKALKPASRMEYLLSYLFSL